MSLIKVLAAVVAEVDAIAKRVATTWEVSRTEAAAVARRLSSKTQLSISFRERKKPCWIQNITVARSEIVPIHVLKTAILEETLAYQRKKPCPGHLQSGIEMAGFKGNTIWCRQTRQNGVTALKTTTKEYIAQVHSHLTLIREGKQTESTYSTRPKRYGIILKALWIKQDEVPRDLQAQKEWETTKCSHLVQQVDRINLISRPNYFQEEVTRTKILEAVQIQSVRDPHVHCVLGTVHWRRWLSSRMKWDQSVLQTRHL